MLIVISAILFSIGIVLLALSAALMVLKIVLWIIMVLLRVAIFAAEYFLETKPQPVQVEPPMCADEEVVFTLTQNKDGTWVLK